MGIYEENEDPRQKAPPSSAARQQREGAERRAPKPRKRVLIPGGTRTYPTLSTIPLDDAEPGRKHIPPLIKERQDLMKALEKVRLDEQNQT